MTNDRIPHPDSTGWTLELTRFEMDRVIHMAYASQPGSGRGQSVTVGVVDCTTRRWVAESATGSTWVDYQTDPTDPQEPVALPRHFLEAASRLADALGMVYIYQDKNSSSFVAFSGNDMVVADPWETDPSGPADLDCADVFHDAEVSAVVDLDTLRRISNEYMQCFDMATAHDGFDAPAHTVISVADGRISWISDWTRWEIPKLSGSSAAETVGKGAVSLRALTMWRLIRFMPPSGSAKISWDAADPWAVTLESDDFGLRCVVNDEAMARHEGDILKAFDAAGYGVVIEDLNKNVFGSTRIFAKDDFTVVVTVLDPDPSVTDFLRLSTRVATIDADLPAVRSEIDRLNETFAGAKLVVRDRGIFLVVDVPAQDEAERYVPSISLLEFYAARCEGLDEFLPLFSLAD